MERQAELLDNGKTPVQETRGWDATKSITFSQRTKEDAEDYRYFPDPDLPPIRFTQKRIDELKSELPELPKEKMARWESEFGVEPRYSDLLINSLETATVLEKAFKQLNLSKKEPNKLANTLANKKITFEGDADTLIKRFKELFATDDIPEDEIVAVIHTVMEANSDAVEKFKAGQKQVIGFFMGQTMRALGGKKVDNKVLSSLLIKELSK